MKDFFAKFKGYLSEVKGEAKRVSWPDKHELYDSTIVVIAFIFILAVTTVRATYADRQGEQGPRVHQGKDAP